MMEIKDKIISRLKKLTGHRYIEIIDRGNSAVWSALQTVKEAVLVPEEGGWLTYLDYPLKLGLKLIKVKTEDAVIDLEDLKEKSKTADAFLYHSLGGYFAEEPIKKIYNLCKKNKCLVIMDVSGSIGTRLCDGRYADIILGSFGRWKLVDAHAGGFISSNDGQLFEAIKSSFKVLEDEAKLEIILEKINHLDRRIDFLAKIRSKLLDDLDDFEAIRKEGPGFVVIVKYKDSREKEKLINYCINNHLRYTECPRYIRLNKKAISIEIKRIEGADGQSHQVLTKIRGDQHGSKSA